jgi:hypothetical protein
MPTSRRALLITLVAILALSAAYAERPVRKPQESFAPYWTAEPGWDTELQLKNNLTSGPLTVTPVLRLASGEEIPLDSVTIPSNVSVSVWVNEQLLKHSPSVLNLPGSYGSVVFRFTSLSAGNLYATAAPSLYDGPIVFPVLAHPASRSFKGNGPGSLEGIWWQPRAGLNDVLIIGNSSEKKIGGTLSLSDASGKRWSEALVLAPRQTMRMATSELLQKAGLSGTYGGISFEVPALASAVDGVHFMYNEAAKFSASLEMSRRDPNSTLLERAGKNAKQWIMRAPMLALRTPDLAIGLPPGTVLQPTIFVRNTTAKNIAAEITLNWHGPSGKGEAKLPELHLGPFATQQLQIGPMQTELGIPDNANWGLVSLTTDALPDDLIAIATSRDTSGRYGAEARLAGGLGDYFAGGEWRADATHNEIAAVTNIGPEATDALLTLHYDNGEKKYEMQQTIQPGDQMWVNLAELIRNRVPDRKGNILPVDVSAMTYDLRDLTAGSHSLTANALSVDKRMGFSVHHNYPVCCPYSGVGWSPGVFDVVIDGTDFGEIGGFNYCTNELVNISYDFNDWWSANPAIATVANTGKITGLATGTTTASASGYVLEGCDDVVPVQVNAPVTVQPQITAVNQVYGAQGFVPMRSSTVSDGDNYISYTATCSPSNGDFSWTTNSSNVTLENTTGPTVTVYSAKASTSRNDTSIQVTCSLNGETSAAVAATLTVQQPTKVLKTGTDQTSSEATCPVGGTTGCGINPGRTFTYQVQDQLTPSNAINAQLDFFDGISTVSGSNGCNLTSYTTTCPSNSSCGKLTGTKGTFPEQLSICAAACISGGKCVGRCAGGPTQANQTWTVNGYPLSTDIKALTYNCASVLVNGQ